MYDLNTLPTNPGCYLFKNTQQHIIYIGKAKNIKKRVKSYFQKPTTDPKTQALLTHIDDLDYIITDTELEALLLEDTLVKKHQPKYNIRLKDAKSFAYLQITNETYPRLQIARHKTNHGTYYGPFTSAQERDYLLNYLRKTFQLRTCKKLPKRACLRHHIHLCSAPCTGNITQEDYLQNIKQVKLALNGKTTDLITQLHQEMNQAAEHQQYENALTKRNQIQAMEYLNHRQKIQRDKTYNEDIINYIKKEDTIYLMLFNIHKGTLENKNEFIFDYHPNFLEEFITRYYSDHPIPKELILPKNISTTLTTYLTQKRGNNVTVTIPKKGEKKNLLSLVNKNIQLTFFSDITKIEELQKKIHLQELPTIIECFDISHLSGTSTVGSMVQFRNGKPDKSNYRRFRIRSVHTIDDTKAIAEVVRRRYTRLQKEHQDFPNLIIIDGGRAQLNTALSELQKLNVRIPALALAKQNEEIYLPGRPQPLRLQKKEKALQFLQQIRDEAHRFAIKYNRLLRKKELIT